MKNYSCVHFELDTITLSIKKLIFVIKIDVYIFLHFLCSIKNFNNLKIKSLSIFKNSKYQIIDYALLKNKNNHARWIDLYICIQCIVCAWLINLLAWLLDKEKKRIVISIKTHEYWRERKKIAIARERYYYLSDGEVNEYNIRIMRLKFNIINKK